MLKVGMSEHHAEQKLLFDAEKLDAIWRRTEDDDLQWYLK